MNVTCLRCDWEGETDATGCPRCGAPLYRLSAEEPASLAPDEPTEAPAQSRDRVTEREGPKRLRADPFPTAPRPGSTRPGTVLAVVGLVFASIVILLLRGDLPRVESPRVSPTPPSPAETGGILVYSVPDGSGAARLWLWNLATDEVARGPLIGEPSTLVNVQGPGHGWLGLTSNLGNGVIEAAILDSLEPDAQVEPLGRGDIVTWAQQGSAAVLVDRGPLLDGCRREVRITALHVRVAGRENVMHETICGDILSAGQTSLGFFLTRQGLDGVDVVGAASTDAGLLLPGHGVIAIAPGGDMLVTPTSEFLPAVVPTRPVTPGYDPPPLRVTGAALHFVPFGGDPVPYVVRRVPLRVDEVLAYAPGSTTALAIGRLGGERVGLWEVPLGVSAAERDVPRYVADVEGPTAAAYAADGTGFVVTEGRLWRLRNHRLTPLDVPEGAPTPSGPLAWIVREPINGL